MENFSNFLKKIHPAGAAMVRITTATCGSPSRVVVVDQRMGIAWSQTSAHGISGPTKHNGAVGF
jgi:hypothetical protein